MAVFFIDTSNGRIATQRQLIEAGIATAIDVPPRPWHKIQGTGDATTMWYALLRRREKHVFIGALVLRHTDHYASLLEKGWEEVPVDEIAAPSTAD
jgi:hypothetical protein